MKVVLALLVIGCIAVETTAAAVERKQDQNHVKQSYLKRRTRQAQTHETVAEPVKVEINTNNQPVTIAVPTNMAEACTSNECTGRGTCFGTKQSPICLCQIGFAGSRCEDTYCDSARDCSGHGLCMGTQRQFSCLCNLGFTGDRCEHEAVQTQTVIVVQSTPAPAPAPTPAPHSESSHNHQ